jgi:chaperonin GroEL
VATIVSAIAPTLGPLPRAVAVQRPDHAMLPELLDDGATIARRIVALPDEAADPGAMYLRGFLWRLHEEAGDGTATAATLFGALLKNGRRALASGVSAQQLRPRLEAAAELVREELRAQAVHRDGRAHVARLARAISRDDEMAELLGEIFDVSGEFGAIVALPSKRRESWAEFVNGSYWEGGAHGLALFDDQIRLRSDLIDPALLLTNLALDDVSELASALEAALSSGAGGLVVIAESITERATALLHANNRPDCRIVAVKPPGFGELGRQVALQDLAILTGGRVFWQAAGDRLGRVQPADLGRARQAWATTQQFGIVSGQGDPRAIHRHAADLEKRYDQAVDNEERQKIQERLGVLHGVSATLWIGGDSDLGAKNRLERAKQTTAVLRRALRDGTVPGGGLALLHCQAALRDRLAETTRETERAALRIVAAALDAPFRQIMANCGHEPSAAFAKLATAPAGMGIDAVTGQLVEPREAGIVDPLSVVTAAATTAIRSAALALTIDAIVHTRTTEISVDPE